MARDAYIAALGPSGVMIDEVNTRVDVTRGKSEIKKIWGVFDWLCNHKLICAKSGLGRPQTRAPVS